jgi:hypothetical protein
MGKEKKVYTVLVRNPEGKRPLGRPRRRKRDRIRMDVMLGRLAQGGVEWIQLAQDGDRWWTLVNTVMNLRIVVPRS